MSLEDPFFVVKEEVLKALSKTRGLFERWKEEDCLRSNEEREWSSTELNNSLRSIEWDLEDLDDTVQIVEKNPARFKIDKGELLARKEFIKKTRDEVRCMKERASSAAKPQIQRNSLDNVPLGSPTTKGVKGSSTKYSRLPNDEFDEVPQPDLPGNDRLPTSQNNNQVSKMSESSSNIRCMSDSLGTDIDEHAIMLDEFGAEMANAESKLDATMRKMSKVIHMSNDRRQWMAIGILSSAMIIILLMLLI
ncbi:syntaxin-6 [Lepeophtheirus salmonis]|uniref:syntaxin-6 n=1 Tax=Lepeophtheirus salmonis TaxID=72036 RepID=UPI001AE7F089|nr:syntaxin-6-like [Lepeophtheirus salmonis]